jgi:hypothetical protein
VVERRKDVGHARHDPRRNGHTRAWLDVIVGRVGWLAPCVINFAFEPASHA